MSNLEYDPDELDRAAHALGRAREQIRQEARQIRGTVQGMNRFRGGQADRFRAEADQLVKQLDRNSDETERLSRALKNLAAQVRQLRI